jgi:YegS/Rv2252/BmrU family lipid kinase
MLLGMTRPLAALIYNQAAGGGPLPLDEVQRRLEPSFQLLLLQTSDARPPDACARFALERGAKLLIAAGGDGTVSSAASALIDHTAVLAILPRGTANSFAAALEIPEELDAALTTVLTGSDVKVDSAKANDRLMILHASVGFHAAVVGETSGVSKSRFGVLAYLATAIDKLSTSSSFRARIEADTHSFECRVNNITVASVAASKTLLAQGPTLMLPHDGMLDVTLVAADGLAEVVATGMHLLRAAAQEQSATRDNIGFFPCRRVHIETDPAQPLLIDGESIGEGPLTVECVPSSLTVRVPRDASFRTKAPAPETKLEGLPDFQPKS